MPQASQSTYHVRAAWRPRSLTGGILAGVAFGLLCGGIGLIFALPLMRWSLREVSLPTYLLVYPALGGVGGYAFWRKGQSAGAGPESLPEQSPEAEERRRAARQRNLAVALAVGCAAALLATVVDLPWRGWRALMPWAAFNLVFYPCFCIPVALSLSREPGERLSLRRIRLNIKAVMILIAYLAVVLGVAEEGGRIGGAARRYHFQAVSSAVQADALRQLARKSAHDAPLRRKNAEQLRAGKVPEHLSPVQKTSLESLETAPLEDRARRYALLAAGEDFQARADESNAVTFGKLTSYYEQLAAKYARAESRPWEPVPPDPPRP